MAASPQVPDSSQIAAQGAALQAQLAAGQQTTSGGGGGGGGAAATVSPEHQQKGLFEEMVVETLGPKVWAMLSKYSSGMIINASAPESAAPETVFSSQGLPNKNVTGLNALDSGQASGLLAPIYNALKKLFSNRELADHTGGVGPGEQIAAASGGESLHSGGDGYSIRGADIESLLSGQSYQRFAMSDYSPGESVVAIGPAVMGPRENYL